MLSHTCGIAPSAYCTVASFRILTVVFYIATIHTFTVFYAFRSDSYIVLIVHCVSSTQHLEHEVYFDSPTLHLLYSLVLHVLFAIVCLSTMQDRDSIWCAEGGDHGGREQERDE